MRVAFPAWLPSIAGLCLIACGCSHDGGAASLDESVPAPAPIVSGRSRRVAVLVRLPAAAGAVEGVSVQDYVDGVEQDIRLAGSTVPAVRNGITLRARTSQISTLDEQIPLQKPTEEMIRSELDAQFPHLAMRVATRASSNAYGDYGLALGRTDGDRRCLYMWQWIDADHIPAEAGIGGPISLRVRLCWTATTFDAMSAVLDRLAIGTFEEVADSAGPAPARSARGRHMARLAMSKRRDAGASRLPPDLPLDRTSTASASIVAADLPPEATRGPLTKKAD